MSLNLSRSGMLTATSIGAFALFALLAPGFLLTLPGGSQGRCKQLVPSPTSGVTNDCDDTSPDAALVDICYARKKCTEAWVSGYTNIGAVFLHALVFVLFLGFFINFISTLPSITLSGGEVSSSVSASVPAPVSASV